jgi:hypothetical protein
MNVVAPEEMVGNDWPRGMQYRHHSFERERFISL